MNNKVRAGIILVGCFVTLAGSIALPWFIIQYNPTGGYYTYNFDFDFLYMAFNIKDPALIDHVKSYFISIGTSSLIAVLYLTDLTFLKPLVVKLGLSLVNMVIFGWAVFTNAHDLSIITHLQPSYAQTYFGTTDYQYILSHTTTSLSQGFVVSLIGIGIMAVGLNLPENVAAMQPQRFYTVLIAIILLSCCCLATFDATHGIGYGYNNDFYEKSHRFPVMANQGWQNTAIDLKKGDIVYILYIPNSGLWSANTGVSPASDASGNPTQPAATNEPTLPLPNFPNQALIGKIGKDTAFLIGNGVSFLAYDNGPMTLRMNQNDALLKNASGSIQVLIAVYRYMSGETVNVNTVTINSSTAWQDTHLNVGVNDTIGISYILHSHSANLTDFTASPNGTNAPPPDFNFIKTGTYSGPSPLAAEKPGLIAKIGSEPGFFAGYNVIGRTISQMDTGNLFLSIHDSTMPQGTLQVTIVQVHLGGVATSYWI